MKLPNLPADDRQVSNGMGKTTEGYWIFFSTIARVCREFVIGAKQLLTVGAIPKVTAAGTLGESRFSETEVQYMVASLQADLATLAATLTAADAGKLVEVTDYRHILRWTGLAWSWGPTEDGRHDIVALPVDPNPTTGWQLCDGTATTYLKSDGTTGAYTTPNLTASGAYLKLGTPVSGPNAAVAPTLSGVSTAAASTGITAATSGPSGPNTTVVQGSGASISLPNVAHTHLVSVTDPQHSHSLSGGTISADGEPPSMVLRPWFRK